MAVPQLAWVDVEPCGSSPLPTNVSNRLSSEMSLYSEPRKYIAVSFTAAKRLKKLERVTGNSNSPRFGSFSKEVNLTAIRENFDVLPPDNNDLRDSATQETRTPVKGVITNSVTIEMSSPGNRRYQQPHLFIRQAAGRLLSVERKPARAERNVAVGPDRYPLSMNGRHVGLEAAELLLLLGVQPPFTTSLFWRFVKAEVLVGLLGI